MPGPHRPETRPSSCQSRAPACSLCGVATAARRTGSQVRLRSEPVYLALLSLRMGVGGGAQSCACGGCRWVTHPHRSLLHQFWWGKAPLIGFVENGLPPLRSGRDAAYGLTGGTVSWRVPYAGETPAAAGCLPSPRSARPPAHRAALPAAARECASRLSTGSGGTMLAAVGKLCPQRPAPCRRFLLAAVAALPINAVRMRFGGGEGCKSPRGLAPPPDGSGVKRNLFDVRPLFHLTPLPPAARGRLSVLAKAKPVFHWSGSALWFCLGYGLLYWLPGLIGLGLGLNPIECRTQPYWVGDCTLLDAGGRAGSRLASTFEPFSASVGVPSRLERAAA